VVTTPNTATSACDQIPAGNADFKPRQDGALTRRQFRHHESRACEKCALAGDTARAATTGEVQDLRREARALKECVADLTLENRLLRKA
jgi:hypothetical protein